MWRSAVAVLVAVCWTWGGAGAARILTVMTMPSQSHINIISSVTRGLADKGHDVTFITPAPLRGAFPPNHKTVTIGDIVTKEELDSFATKFIAGESNPVLEIASLWNMGSEMVRRTFANPVFQAEINKPGASYDLIVLEVFFFVEGYAVLGHKFNAPIVAVNAFGTNMFLDDVMGNPINPSWVPSPFLSYSDHMTLYQRTVNTLFAAYMYAGYYLFHLPKQQALISEYFPEAPPLRELLITKVALTLVNNHFTLFYPVPTAPNVVEIGGIQISEKRKPLPRDLQEFMDGAKDGVVYFSMGSNLKLQFLDKERADAILGALGSLDQQVLLKWDGPPPKVAPNIRIVDWAPQADLLAHPNMRLFVTHGGLLSTQESIYNGVPLVGIPVFGDQKFNMLLAVNKGFCVKVDIDTITEEGFKAALREVINNPKYAETAKRMSARFRSKPQGPMDTAVFWVEHVLAHGGDHLRPSSVNLSWYQLLLLDVLLVLMSPMLLLYLLCCRRRKTATKATNKRKKTD